MSGPSFQDGIKVGVLLAAKMVGDAQELIQKAGAVGDCTCPGCLPHALTIVANDIEVINVSELNLGEMH